MLPAVFCLDACTAAFGPGYTIEKQEIQVRFVPAPEPNILIDATYQLRNTGNQPLSSLELRLPGRRRFHFADARALWDQHAVAIAPSSANPRNVLLTLPGDWKISAAHSLHLSVEYQRAEDERSLSFTSDAFFLPAEGWSPELLPARGLLATGGVPPAKWNLIVRVPDGFMVHVSGEKFKKSRHNGEQVLRAQQRPGDGYPFVIAGRYLATQFRAGQETVNLWTHTAQNPSALREPSEALVRVIQAYDKMFGSRTGGSQNLWIVECPLVTGCFTTRDSNYAKLVSGETDKTSSEMASSDTVLVDLSAGTPVIAAAATPSLASTWLGYGQNPGFYEQTPPLYALPAFAASRGRAAVEGPQVRTETIRHVLRAIPVRSDARTQEDANVVRAKSLLFFYGLQDRYGQEVFRKAISHMLEARHGRGFNLDDLISSFEEETHQNVAQFVRRWMKHPGVPDEFRARYEDSAGTTRTTTKERAE